MHGNCGQNKCQSRGLEGSKVPRTQQALAANEAVKMVVLTTLTGLQGVALQSGSNQFFFLGFFFFGRIPEPVTLNKCQSH